ncbi:MAG TPA: VCBS repeat-containing protein [Thermoanaerobaculia bacterium]
MLLVLLAALVSLESPDLERTSLLRFQPYDAGLPRSGQWRHGFAVADMNGDARPDLAFSSPRKQPGPPVILLNEGNGQWRRWQEAKFPALPFDYGAVAAADFDGNGTNDLAIGSHYRGVMVVLGDGRGTFVASPDGFTFPASRQAPPAPFSSRAVVAVDWNRDGRMDVAALSDGPRPLVSGVQLGVTVFENLGSAWKQTRASRESDVVFGDSIATGDVDGDGLPDLVTASHNTADPRVLRLGSDSALERREVQTLLRPDVIRAVDAHDFDGDGRDEIVIAYTSPAEPRQATIELVSFPAGSGPPRRLWSGERIDVVSLAAGDVNGDGAPDVVAGLQDGRLLTFRGDGRGFVTRDIDIEPPQWRRGCTPYGVRLADVNGDARDEIVAAFAGEESGCASNGGVEVWRTVPAARRRAVRP